MKALPFTLLVLLAIACVANAYPMLNGPTGIVAVPTADIAGMGHLQIAADYYNSKDDSEFVGNAVPIRAVFGVLPYVEVGASYWLTDAAVDNLNSWNVNAKVKCPIGLFGFSPAAGAFYGKVNLPVPPIAFTSGGQALPLVAITGDDSLTTEQLYLAGTRNLLPAVSGIEALKLTVGANWTKFKSNGSDVDGIREFAALELALLNKLSLGAEYQTKKSDLGDADPLTSLVARYAVNPALSIEAGWTNAEAGIGGFNTSTKHRLFAGAIYNWGAK